MCACVYACMFVYVCRPMYVCMCRAYCVCACAVSDHNLFGQDKEVFIYRLLAKGTMEQKVYHRQVLKMAQAQRVVENEQAERLYTKDDITELFTLDTSTDEDLDAVAVANRTGTGTGAGAGAGHVISHQTVRDVDPCFGRVLSEEIGKIITVQRGVGAEGDDVALSEAERAKAVQEYAFKEIEAVVESVVSHVEKQGRLEELAQQKKKRAQMQKEKELAQKQPVHPFSAMGLPGATATSAGAGRVKVADASLF